MRFHTKVFTQVSNPLHPWCHSCHNQRKQQKHLTKAELLNSNHSKTQEKTTWITFYLTFTSVATVKVNQELILQARAEHQVSSGNWHSFCKFHLYYNVGLDNYGQLPINWPIITFIMISIQITVISYDYSLIFNDKNNKVVFLRLHISTNLCIQIYLYF